MKKLFFVFIALGNFLATTDVLASQNRSLLAESIRLEKRFLEPDFNPSTCSSVINEELQNLESTNFSDWNRVEIYQKTQPVLEALFKVRQAIHSRLEEMPKDCIVSFKKLLRTVRLTADMVGVIGFNDLQLHGESLDFKRQPIPIYEKEAYHPYHLNSQLDPNKKFEFKNGDIMITKGVSFVSSTISGITDQPSVFSHTVFVHVDDKTKKVRTIESYVGKGVLFYDIDEALKNENARILVLRAKDSKLAAKAANYMAKRVEKSLAAGHVIPYDYKLDFNDNSKMSCAEVALDAFKTASDGKVILPYVPSTVSFSDDDFLTKIGIRKGNIFTPSDLEVDPRFDVVLDWTDYRLMRDSWIKDAVLSESLRWMDQLGYRIHDSLTAIGAEAVWAFRPVPGVWNLLSMAAGLPSDFAKDVPSKTVGTMGQLNDLGKTLLPILRNEDFNQIIKTHYWLSATELRQTLDKARQIDGALYYGDQKCEAKIHKIIRPD
ncbi:MAG: hypothetical protein ACXVCY_09570 [Pseudobdellovibrionaceae bacterium]